MSAQHSPRNRSFQPAPNRSRIHTSDRAARIHISRSPSDIFFQEHLQLCASRRFQHGRKNVGWCASHWLMKRSLLRPLLQQRQLDRHFRWLRFHMRRSKAIFMNSGLYPSYAASSSVTLGASHSGFLGANIIKQSIALTIKEMLFLYRFDHRIP